MIDTHEELTEIADDLRLPPPVHWLGLMHLRSSRALSARINASSNCEK